MLTVRVEEKHPENSSKNVFKYEKIKIGNKSLLRRKKRERILCERGWSMN